MCAPSSDSDDFCFFLFPFSFGVSTMYLKSNLVFNFMPPNSVSKNSPRSMYQNCNIKKKKKKQKKKNTRLRGLRDRNITRKPRSHVRKVIYQTWAIKYLMGSKRRRRAALFQQQCVSSIQYGLPRTVFHIDHYMHFFTHLFYH